MDVTPAQIAAPVALQPVAVGPTADPAHLPIIHEATQAVARGGVEDRADGVMQQLKWIEKLVFVAIFLALYAIMKKWVCVWMCSSICMYE